MLRRGACLRAQLNWLKANPWTSSIPSCLLYYKSVNRESEESIFTTQPASSKPWTVTQSFCCLVQRSLYYIFLPKGFFLLASLVFPLRFYWCLLDKIGFCKVFLETILGKHEFLSQCYRGPLHAIFYPLTSLQVTEFQSRKGSSKCWLNVVKTRQRWKVKCKEVVCPISHCGRATIILTFSKCNSEE